MTRAMTRDGVVHKTERWPEEYTATAECGLTDVMFLTKAPVTCPECLKVVCPKCGQRVATEVIHGRSRKVTTTVVHIKPGPAVCHAILKTEMNR